VNAYTVENTATSASAPEAPAPLGILMLQTQFERVLGDGGNASTWSFPTLLKTVPDATPDAVVHRGASGLVERFIEAGQQLVEAGAVGLTTSCGFMVLHQRVLADACGVPVATSALLQGPMVQTLLATGLRVGVITASERSLTQQHLHCANLPADTPIVGLAETSHLAHVLLHNTEGLKTTRAREDVLEAGTRLLAKHDNIGAIVLECTNLPPYAADLSSALQLPVFDFYTMVNWFYAGLSPQRF
jgi:hypothetical protein